MVQPASVEPLPQLSHRAEIQDLQLFESASSGGGGEGEAVLASVDCYGRALLAHCRRPGPGEALQVAEVMALQPQDPLRCVVCAACCAVATV